MPSESPSSLIGKTKVVPVSAMNHVSGCNNQIKCDAWCENEQNRGEEIECLEPFIKKEDESRVKIFAIDVEKQQNQTNCDTNTSKLLIQNNKKKTRLKLVKLCKCCPWNVPWMLLIISAIQICMFLFNNDVIYRTLIFSPIKLYEVWRFITYTFLHAGAVHLILNIIIQILVAFPLETEQGHLKVLFVYFIGVFSGALGASVFEPTLMIGASAGVYGLLLSHIPHIIMNFSSLSHRYFRVIAVFVLCLSDVVYSIRHCLTRGNSQPRIGVAAHISGAISGLLMGFIMYKGTKSIIFRVTKYASLLVYIGWFIATVLYNVDREYLDFL